MAVGSGLFQGVAPNLLGYTLVGVAVNYPLGQGKVANGRFEWQPN